MSTAGARNGSQRTQASFDPARPIRIVRAGQKLSVRLRQTTPDLPELRGKQGELDIPRRVAQIELSLTVVSDMGGELQAAAQGLTLLDETARLALDSGLSHQLRSIESIRMDPLAEAR